MAKTPLSIKDVLSVECEIKSGRKWVKTAELATQGLKPKTAHFSDNRLLAQLYPTHSTIEEYEFWFYCVVTERIHTHIVRHKEIGKYVQTSRPDISKRAPRAPEGYRFLALKINAKRLVEICMDRLCHASHVDTVMFMKMVRDSVIEVEPCMQYVLFSKCVWHDECVEVNTNCGYWGTSKWNTERALWRSKLTEIRENKRKRKDVK